MRVDECVWVGVLYFVEGSSEEFCSWGSVSWGWTLCVYLRCDRLRSRGREFFIVAGSFIRFCFICLNKVLNRYLFEV